MKRQLKDSRYGPRDGWTLYVVNLKKIVLKKPQFRQRNPIYIQGKPCVYVGLTVKSAAERLHIHMTHTGPRKQHSNWVRRFGKKLRESDCKRLEPMSRTDAEKEEAMYAENFRAKGWAVWEGKKLEW